MTKHSPVQTLDPTIYKKNPKQKTLRASEKINEINEK